MFEITIEDLRKLGRQGGATVRLYDGSDYTITPFEARANQKVKAIIGGKQCLVIQEKSFTEIISEIRTIKRNGQIVARRKNGSLLITGRGYQRDKHSQPKYNRALK